MIGQLRDVYQSILLDAYIDEATKVGDVGHDARQHLSFVQILNLLDIGIEREDLNVLTGVTPRFV